MAAKKRGRKIREQYTGAEFRRGYDGLIQLLESCEFHLKSGGPFTPAWYGWAPLQAAVTAYLDTWSPHETNGHLLAHAAAELASMDKPSPGQIEISLSRLESILALQGYNKRFNRRRVGDALAAEKKNRLLRAHRLFQILSVGIPCKPAPGVNRAIRNSEERRLLEERFSVLDE